MEMPLLYFPCFLTYFYPTREYMKKLGIMSSKTATLCFFNVS